MPARNRANTILTRLTGFELRRGRPAAAAAKATTPAKKTAAKKTAAKKAAGRKDAARNAAPMPDRYPSDFDSEMIEIMRAVGPFTMTRPDKMHALISAARYVARYGVPGAVVECGVWRGGGMHAVARVFAAAGIQDRELYLYDTFEGMTAPTEKDVRHDGRPAADRLAAAAKSSKVWAVSSLEEVQAGFIEAAVPYPQERLHFVKGPVEETIPAQLPEQIAILRLDTDWYESTAHELKHMYDLLVPGGVLMIDDYGHWKGSRTATDEFLERTGERLLLVRMGTGRVAVKP